MNARFDSLMIKLHARLAEIKVTDFSLFLSAVPDTCLLVMDGFVYRVCPDKCLEALEQFDVLDSDDPDYFNVVRMTIRAITV